MGTAPDPEKGVGPLPFGCCGVGSGPPWARRESRLSVSRAAAISCWDFGESMGAILGGCC